MVATQALPQNKVKWTPGGICHPQWLQGPRYWRVTCKQYNFWVLWFLQPWVGSVWQNPKWVGLTPGTNEEFDLASPQCSIMTRWLLWDAGSAQLKPFRQAPSGAQCTLGKTCDPVSRGPSGGLQMVRLVSYAFPHRLLTALWSPYPNTPITTPKRGTLSCAHAL